MLGDKRKITRMDNSYTVLARKYRSQDFKSLIGQDVLVKTLTTAINTSRIAHAYIFTGIRGTGKTSTARILAKALNCLSSDKATATPCGTCENCRAIAAGQHIDVMEIDAASHTGVDNM
ncbi:MAG: DNA polymerase III subunit gamma/tau, partial [Alphaproteobacteria bacterium]|nr:DNA polymerase III subunit gamma/tau [Alphaproteobacteria bacterium]